MRSIFGLERVTQTVRPCGSRGGSLPSGTSGSPACAQAAWPPSKNLGRGCAGVAQPGRNALAQLLAFFADDDGERPTNSGAQDDTVS